MVSLDTIQVRQLPKTSSKEEAAAAAQVMDAAFARDEFTRLLVGGFVGSDDSDDSKSANLLPVRHRASIGAGLIGGKVYVAESPSVGIVGAAVWFGPGEQYLSSKEQAEAGFNLFMSELGALDPEMPKWWTTYFLPTYRAFTSEALKDPRYKLDGWHLQLIGVLPDFQHHGIGALLINHVKEEVAKLPDAKPENRRLSAETETDGALQFYKQLGFTERGKTIIDGQKRLHSSCPMWCLALEMN